MEDSQNQHQNNVEGENGRKDEQSSPLLFSCRCESVKAVSTLLSCLRQVNSSSSSSFGVSDHATSYNYSGLMSQAPSRRVGLSVSETGINARGGGKTQCATVFVSPDALTFHVQGFAKQSQASVQLQAGLFSEYYVGSYTLPAIPLSELDASLTPTAEPQQIGQSETIHGGEFCINLTTVLECLHVLGTSNLDRTTLGLSYDRSEAIFKIELLEDHQNHYGSSLLSTCAIPGLAVPDDQDDVHENGSQPNGSTSLAIAFRSKPILARAILSSSYLRPAILELMDLPGATCCTVGLSPDGIQMGAVGFNGECLVSLPFTTTNTAFNTHNMTEPHLQVDPVPAYISLECDPPKLHTRSYPIHSFLQGMRGLEVANETCVSMNAMGMIAIQHQVLDTVGKGEPNFVDFIMGDIQDDDDEEEEEEERYNNTEKDQNEQVDTHINMKENSGRSRFTKERISSHDKSTIRYSNRNEEYHDSKDDENERTESDQESDTSQSLLGFSSSQNKQNKSDLSVKTSAIKRRRIHESQDSSQKVSEKDTNSSASSTDDDDQFHNPNNRNHKTGTNNDVTSSPELLFGDTRLEPSPSPSTLRRNARLALQRGDNSMSQSGTQGRYKRGIQTFNYSDDETDEDKF